MTITPATYTTLQTIIASLQLHGMCDDMEVSFLLHTQGNVLWYDGTQGDPLPLLAFLGDTPVVNTDSKDSGLAEIRTFVLKQLRSTSMFCGVSTERFHSILAENAQYIA